MSHLEHERAAGAIVVRVAILTLSDSRTIGDDSSGQAIVDALTAAGHAVTSRDLIADDAAALAEWIKRCASDVTVDAMIATGGTGITSRDITVDVIEPMFERALPGFGELFRTLSFQQIGPAAMLSRATAGIVGGKPVFALPGSTNAVRLAMTDLITPQLRHMIAQLRR